MIFEQRYKLKDFALIEPMIKIVVQYDSKINEDLYTELLRNISNNRLDIIGKSAFGFGDAPLLIDCIVPDLDKMIILTGGMIEPPELSKIKLL